MIEQISSEEQIIKQKKKLRIFSGSLFLILLLLIAFASIWSVKNQRKITLQQKELQTLFQEQQQLKLALTEQQQLQQTFAQQMSLLMNNNQQNQTQVFLQEISILLHLAQMELNVYHASDRAFKILSFVEHRITQNQDKRFQSLLEAIQSDEKILQQDVKTEAETLQTIQQLQKALQSLSITQQKKLEVTNVVATPPQPTTSWKQKMRANWPSLEKFIVIRHFDDIQPRVLDQQSKELLKQQLLSLSSLLVWAVTHQQNEMFQQTLQQIKTITEQYFQFDQTSLQSIQQQVAFLQKKNVDPSLITIDKTMNALFDLENQLRKS